MRAKLKPSGQRADRVESAQHLLIIHSEPAHLCVRRGAGSRFPFRLGAFRFTRLKQLLQIAIRCQR
jgi:hypothetical protein